MEGYDNPVFATLIALRDQIKGSDERALDLRDRLDDEVALVTGANRGLGRAIASALASRGAHVLMSCRSDGTEALHDVRREGSDGELLHVDLADTDTIHLLADELKTRGPIHCLVLNAGVVPARSRPTRQGFDVQIGVNYLANVLLTQRLIDDGTLAPDARVVVVSSETHRAAHEIDLVGLGDAAPYGTGGVMAQYSYTKLLLTAWAFHLDRSTDLTVHCIGPGPVASGIAREAPRWSHPLLDPIMRAFFAPPALAAKPVLYLACAQSLGDRGRYFHRFDEKQPSALALDPVLGERLYDCSLGLLERRAGRTPSSL